MSDASNVIPLFPTSRRMSREAADAVLRLAKAELITELEAVTTLENLGVSPGEIETVRLVYAARRSHA